MGRLLLAQRYFATAVGAACALFIGVAGYLKCVDLNGFYGDLQAYVLIPEGSKLIIMFAVPAIEISLALLWLFNWHRKAISLISVMMLLAFSGVYALHMRRGVVPPCGCYGILKALERLQGTGPVVLWRNAGLIAGMVLYLVYIPKSVHGSSGGRTLPRRDSDRQLAAFTLIEMIVVLACISLLIVLSLNGIATVHAKSRETTSVIRLQGHTQVFAMYAGDYSGYMPYFGPPNELGMIRTAYFNLPEADSYFFATSITWHLRLAPDYYSGMVDYKIWNSPDRHGVAGDTDFSYACSWIARPEFWNPHSRGNGQISAVRLDEAIFPSRKGVLSDVYAAWNLPNHPIRASCADGSASIFRANALLSGYPGGERPVLGSIHSTSDFPPMHHTIDGVRGCDLK